MKHKTVTSFTVKQWKQERAKDRRQARGRETQSLKQTKCRQVITREKEKSQTQLDGTCV